MIAYLFFKKITSQYISPGAYTLMLLHNKLSVQLNDFIRYRCLPVKSKVRTHVRTHINTHIV